MLSADQINVLKIDEAKNELRQLINGMSSQIQLTEWKVRPVHYIKVRNRLEEILNKMENE